MAIDDMGLYIKLEIKSENDGSEIPVRRRWLSNLRGAHQQE